MSRPPVLFLNGTSSAGKTTVAKAFQRLWHDPVVYASIDSFIFMFADHVLNNDEVRKVALWPLISAFNQSLPKIANAGFPMVVDYVMESRVWLEECLDSLAGHEVYFIGVKCPLEELERREVARGDRQVGFARWQHDRVHRYGAYDLELDTHLQPPKECAGLLRDLVHSGRRPEAFPRLREELQKECSDEVPSTSPGEVAIVLYSDAAHRSDTVALWAQVFGYATAHNEPNLAIERKLAVRDGLFFVAVQSGRVVGSIMAGYDGHRGWLYSLAVLPEHRKHGLGTALVKRAEQAQAERGCLKVNLQVLEDNARVVEFYRTLGYAVEPRISLGKRLLAEALPGV